MSIEIVVEYKGETLKGILLKEDYRYMTIKLKSGYNSNVLKSKCKIVSKKKVENRKSEKVIRDKGKDLDLPKVVILHTGGTIASKVDYKTGAVSSKFTPNELISMYPELNEIVHIEAKMIGNIFSGDMNLNHWNLLLDEIDKVAQKKNLVGIIISHGTDTIGYSAPALQYAVENLNIPIVIVGAQRSSDRASSDAYSNLRAAVVFIKENSKLDKAFRRICVCMHGNISDKSFVIFDGINIRKMHSSRRDAFKQINYEHVADIVDDKVVVNRKELFTEEPSGRFSYSKYNAKLKVGFFKSHPNLMSREIRSLEFYDGVVIEGTGLGHMAVDEIDEFTKENSKNLSELKSLTKKVKVVMSTQCVYGGVNLNVYSYGRHIKETGVFGHGMNLTSETLFSRLAYCLSKGKRNFEKVWNSDLEGFSIRSADVSYEK